MFHPCAAVSRPFSAPYIPPLSCNARSISPTAADACMGRALSFFAFGQRLQRRPPALALPFRAVPCIAPLKYFLYPLHAPNNPRVFSPKHDGRIIGIFRSQYKEGPAPFHTPDHALGFIHQDSRQRAVLHILPRGNKRHISTRNANSAHGFINTPKRQNTVYIFAACGFLPYHFSFLPFLFHDVPVL